MACGDTNSGCGGNTEKVKAFTLDNLKYLLSKLSGKIILAVGSIKTRYTLPLHLEKEYDDEGIVIVGSVDNVTTSSDGLMTSEDKVILNKLAADYLNATVVNKVEAGATAPLELQSSTLNGVVTVTGEVAEVSEEQSGVMTPQNYTDLYNLYDRVVLVCKWSNESDDICLVNPSTFKDYNYSQCYGVGIIQDNKVLVISVDEPDPLLWSSGDELVGTAYSKTSEAILDANGETNTDAIIAASKEGFVTDTAEYAAGYCRLYGNDLFPVGSWYLPSQYELMTIKSYITYINYALNLIGQTPIVFDKNAEGAGYWSSTEMNDRYAWLLPMHSAHVTAGEKSNMERHVRPVTCMNPNSGIKEILVVSNFVYNNGTVLPREGGTFEPTLEVTYQQLNSNGDVISEVTNPTGMQVVYSTSRNTGEGEIALTLGSGGVITVEANSGLTSLYKTIAVSIVYKDLGTSMSIQLQQTAVSENN